MQKVKQIHIYADEELYEQLRVAAFKARVSLAEYIRQLIVLGLSK